MSDEAPEFDVSKYRRIMTLLDPDFHQWSIVIVPSLRRSRSTPELSGVLAQKDLVVKKLKKAISDMEEEIFFTNAKDIGNREINATGTLATPMAQKDLQIEKLMDIAQKLEDKVPSDQRMCKKCLVVSDSVGTCQACLYYQRCDACQTPDEHLRRCKDCEDFVCWEKECKRCRECQLKQYNCSIHFGGDTTSCGGKRTKPSERPEKERLCKKCGAYFCKRCSEKLENGTLTGDLSDLKYCFCTFCKQSLA
jgi:hypothetical protein